MRKCQHISCRLQRCLIPALIFLTCALWLLPAADAFDEFSYNLRLVQALSRIGMRDYALLQIDHMLRQYPEKRDYVLITQARMYYEVNQRNQGNEIVEQILPGSPYYAESRVLKAEMAFRRGDMETAETAFKQYFDSRTKPLSNSPEDIENFQRNVQMYAQIFIQRGKGAEAARILGFLGNIEGGSAFSEGQLQFIKAQAVFAAAEQADAEKPSRELITRTVQQMLAIQKNEGAGNYALLIGATLEAAHGYNLLGEYDKAIAVIRDISQLLVMLERDLPPNESVMGIAFYLYGQASKGLAEQARQRGDKEKAKAYLLDALKRFVKVTEDFPASRFSAQAIGELGRVKQTLEKEYNVELPDEVGAGSGAVVARQEAEKRFSARDYAAAAPLYLRALRLGRTGPQVPETGLRLVISYSETGDFLKAHAIASYLVDVYSDRPETGDALLQMGRLMYQQAKELPDEDAREKQIDEAMAAWTQFVEVAPDHPSASQIAFYTAENEYRRAVQAADRSKQAAAPEARSELEAKAKDSYREAIPLYERVIDLYGSTSYGVRAWYKLGGCYYSLGDYEKKAAEAFLKYSQLEADPAYNDQRLQAKLLGAQQLMLSDKPELAPPHYIELLSWLQPGSQANIDASSDVARKVKEDAAANLPWSYDYTAEKLRPELDRIDAAISEAEAALEQQQAAVTAAGAMAAEAGKMDAAAERVYAAKKAGAEQPMPSPEDQARQEIMPPEAEMAAWTDAERQLELPKLQQQVKDRAASYRAAMLTGLNAERLDLEEQKNEITTQRVGLTNEIDAKQRRLGAHEKRLAELRQDLELNTTELERLQKDIDEAQEQIAAVEKENEEWRARLTAARDMYQGGSEEQRAEALKIRENALTTLADNVDRLRQLRERLAIVASQAKQEKIALLKQRNAQARRELTGLAGQVAELQNDIELKTAELALVDARLAAVSQLVARTGLQADLLKMPEAQRMKAAEEKNWTEKQNELLAALQAVYVAETAKADLLKNRAESMSAEAKGAMVELSRQISSLKAEREPVNRSLLERKRLALNEFEAFLEKHPQSDYVPQNMAKIGSIYLELGDYQNAAKYLEQLATRYPDHKAAKQALFSLGKAQFESGNISEAVAVFERILKDAAGQSAGGLIYIGRAMLDVGQSEVALTAYNELLRRGERADNPDFELLSGKTRENLLFRGGRAALEAGRYGRAEDLLTELIETNPRTAHLHWARLYRAQARLQDSPPDTDGGLADLAEVRGRAQDEVLINEALLTLARAFQQEDTENGLQRALGQLRQIVLIAEGKPVILVDETRAENRAYIEEAVYLAARCYALLGMENEKQIMVNMYYKEFPKGRFRQEIGNLPAAKYSPAATSNETGSGT